MGYDFVSVKGQGGKISSSKGGVVTVADCLEVYEPEILRWLFASYRANTEFAISFDLDVIKIYEDYDRVSAARPTKPTTGARRTRNASKRAESSSWRPWYPRTIEPGSSAAQPRAVPASRAPCFKPSMVTSAARSAFFEKEGLIVSEDDRAAVPTFEPSCCWSWIEQYAPEDFRYRIRQRAGRAFHRRSRPRRTAVGWSKILEDNPSALPTRSSGAISRSLAEASGLDLKDFYPLVYDLLLDRDRGPKLTSLLTTMGFDRALPLLKATVEASA